MEKKQTTLAYMIALIPGVALACFYGLVCARRLTDGHWPSYGNPDAGVISGWWAVLHGAVFVLGLFSVLLALLGIGAAFASVDRRLRWLRGPSALFWTAWGIGLFLVLHDPGGFFEWFAD